VTVSNESHEPELKQPSGDDAQAVKPEAPRAQPATDAPAAAPKVESAVKPAATPTAAKPAAAAAATPQPAPKPAAPKAAAKKEEEKPSRRELLTTTVALGAGWICFGGATGIAVGPALGRFLMPNVVEEPDPKVRVGPLSRYKEMRPGEVNEDFKPQKIWMIREEDRIAALKTTCTHLGCIPNWLPNDRKFKCPCHGSGFYPSGINFEGPAPRPLERAKISVENGIVVVDTSRKFQQELGQWDNPDSFLKV
jgi:cytochrome b6-f complex iron-sulfur subunit